MRYINRVLVLWRDPLTGKKFGVGHLWHEPEVQQFCFGYIDSEAGEARLAGFEGIVEFPEHCSLSNPDRSPCLFPTFSKRLPRLERTDTKLMSYMYGFELGDIKDNKLGVLLATGGVKATDFLEIAEYLAT